MFLNATEYQEKQAELRRVMSRLRRMPEELENLLRQFAGEAEQLYRLAPELRAEAWGRRSAELVEQWDARLQELRQQAEELFQRGQERANVLATSVALPESEEGRQAFYSAHHANVERLRLHCTGFASDEGTAQGLRRLREAGVFARDANLALSGWIFVAELLDTVGEGWLLTESEWRNIPDFLPSELRQVVDAAKELGNGYARISIAFAQASRYIRHVAREGVYLPLWNERDGLRYIEPVSGRGVEVAV